MERIQAEKISILRRCKMEEIDIPFVDGKTLNSISMDELDVYILSFVNTRNPCQKAILS